MESTTTVWWRVATLQRISEQYMMEESMEVSKETLILTSDEENIRQENM